MDSRRQLKIASLIKEAFTEILNKGGKNIYGKAFVTVTNATITSDLTLARFYLSIFNSQTPDEVLMQFNIHKHELRKQLAEKLRHHLRRIPEIEFFKDDTLDYVTKIEAVFSKISAEDAEIHNLKNAPPVEEKKPRAKKAAAKKAPKRNED
ncbi:MAG: Ribosome-binding factor [Bacteroidota bacterium]|nr:Ribosome-binding factor [Bacteroidota bacterium]